MNEAHAFRSSIPAVLIGLALILFPVPPLAAGGEEVWARQYDGPEDFSDGARALALSPDGSRIFVSGGVAEFGLKQLATGETERWIATVAYDAATGEELWEAVYRGPAGLNEVAGIAIDPQGRSVFIAGRTWRGEDQIFDYVTIAYAATTGEEMWVRRYNGTGGEDGVRALAVDPEGRTVFVTGASKGKETSLDFVTIGYDTTTGRRRWLAREAHAGIDVATAIALNVSGSKVYITGRSRGGSSINDRDTDYTTVAYRASSGTRLWTGRYRRDRGYAEAIAVAGSKVIVTGWTTNGEKSRYTTVAYRDGRRLWVSHHASPAGAAYADSLAVSPDGSRAFVTGWRAGRATEWDYGTVAYQTSTGGRLWAAGYDSGAGGFDGARSAAVSPDGSILYVTGGSERATNTGTSDYATIAYRARTGRVLWLARYDGPGRGHDSATHVAVSPDGSHIYVTGASEAAERRLNGFPYATVAYAAR